MSDLPAYVPDRDTLRDNRERLIWLAAWLEGEGSFFVGSDMRRGRYPVISATTTDRDVAQRAVAYLGAARFYVEDSKVYEYKTLCRVRLSGKKAVPIMKALLPLMCERRAAKIREVLGV